MEKEQLLNRIHALEEELQAIKRSIEPQTESPGILRLKQTSNFLLSYWPLLSLLFGIVVIAYVQLVYGVDSFESYRAVSTTRNLSATTI